MNPFCLSSQSPHLWKPGEREGNVSFSEILVSPCLWFLKRILFHTLPNLLSLPQLSPYLLFLPFLDDYFLSSSLFFFLLLALLLLFHHLVLLSLSVSFPLPQPSFSPCLHLPQLCLSSPFHSLLSCPISPKVFKVKHSQGQFSLPACC